MGRGNKFENPNRYFLNLKVDEVSMTLKQIENIVGRKLCKSAYEHKLY